MSHAERDHTVDRTHLLALVALACLMFMWGLGAVGLTDRDEGRNAEAGREMFESGDWISPSFNYEPRLTKPAMLYWLMTPAYALFGVNEFAARFPSAIAGVGLIVLQYAFVTRTLGSQVGFMAAIVLLLNLEIIGLGRAALTDMVLTFFTTTSVYAFWIGFHGEGSRRRWLWISYAAMGLATLTKGPIGFCVPLLAIIPYLTVTRQWNVFWARGLPVAGPALFLAVAAPWYAIMMSLHTNYASDAKIQTVSRFINPFYGWGGTIFFYVPVLLIGFFPWSALLPSALWRQYRRWKERGRSAVRGDVNLFAALWCSAVFVFFSLGATRLPHYIGPLFPSAALLAGAYLAHAVREPASGFRTAVRLMVGTGLAVAAFFAAGPIVFGLFADKLAKTFPYAAQFRFGAAPYLAAAVVVIGMALVIYAAGQSDRRPLMFWGAGGSAAIVLLLLFTLILPELSRYMLAPPQDLAALAGRQLRPRDHLIVYGLTRPSTVFYAQRKIIPVGKNEEQNIVPYLSDGGRTMIVMPEALRDRLPPEAARLPVVAERYGWILLAADPVIPARSPTSAGRLPSS